MTIQQPMAPAGWYADNGKLRWWDGARWTEHIAPAGPAAPPPPNFAPWPTRSPQRRTAVGIALGLGLGLACAVVVALIGLAAIGNSPSEDAEVAVNGLSSLAAVIGLIAGCLYGSRKR